jgi:LmbE family N-acetylglucosaminyl deacetylase
MVPASLAQLSRLCHGRKAGICAIVSAPVRFRGLRNARSRCEVISHSTMRFSQPNADLFIPKDQSPADAIALTSHLGIGAHQDDLEFMALHGILECFDRDDRWFGGVICTDGGGSPRTGPYARYTDARIRAMRIEEQRTAAHFGGYSFMAQLGHPSSHAKDPRQRGALIDDLRALLQAARPRFVYTHNPFDKHLTHIGVCRTVIEVIRAMPADQRPERVFGCEVWRGLDWLPEDLKVFHNVDSRPNLAAKLSGVFESQIASGKRYDLAVEGRQLANATFHDPHTVDMATRASYAIDLTELIRDDGPDLEAFVRRVLAAFADSVIGNLG